MKKLTSIILVTFAGLAILASTASAFGDCPDKHDKPIKDITTTDEIEATG